MRRPSHDVTETGLLRVGEVVILTGASLRSALECALIAIKHRALSGLPNRPYEDLACELRAAMAANGQSDVPKPAPCQPVSVRPTVPIDEAATRLGISPRQTRRLAPQLGGQIIGGRWLVDEIALREHSEGTRQWTAKNRHESSPA